MAKAATKKNPPDLTLRNLLALKKRVQVLEDTAKVDGRILSRFDQRLTRLENLERAQRVRSQRPGGLGR